MKLPGLPKLTKKAWQMPQELDIRELWNDLRVAYADRIIIDPVKFAALPSPVGRVGNIVAVSDSNTAVWGATVAGGGGNVVLAWSNGSAWTIIGV